MSRIGVRFTTAPSLAFPLGRILLIAPAILALLAVAALGQTFRFSSGAGNLEGCTLEGAFKNCNSPFTASASCPHTFTHDWFDAVTHPSVSDAVGNGQGALRLATGSAPSVSGTWEVDWCLMRLASSHRERGVEGTGLSSHVIAWQSPNINQQPCSPYPGTSNVLTSPVGKEG